jgi:formate dehydrogenase subunit gamma
MTTSRIKRQYHKWSASQSAAGGYLLLFPFYGTNISDMQVAQVVHGVFALLFVAAMLGHIHIGTVGMEGAFEGMWDGTLDVNCAKQHQDLWAESETIKGHITAPEGKMQPAEQRSPIQRIFRPASTPTPSW